MERLGQAVWTKNNVPGKENRSHMLMVTGGEWKPICEWRTGIPHTPYVPDVITALGNQPTCKLCAARLKKRAERRAKDALRRAAKV
jgi:hypothetical protein